jgi:hypothetical protein
MNNKIFIKTFGWPYGQVPHDDTKGVENDWELQIVKKDLYNCGTMG